MLKGHLIFTVFLLLDKLFISIEFYDLILLLIAHFKYDYLAYTYIYFLKSFKINIIKYKTVCQRHAKEININKFRALAKFKTQVTIKNRVFSQQIKNMI